MNNPKSTISFKDSLKSWDTENWLDRIFYRPLGFKIAMLLRNTGVTPNAITIISIFVGIGGCLLFYPNNLAINMAGFALLVCANILDCVDGQLARITGIKSEIGRILDGIAGDLWFVVFYFAMAFRLINFEGWGWWTYLIIVVSGISHLTQAGMVDHYKTLHLHFLSGGKNSEFENSKSIQKHSRSLTWETPVKKIFFRLYYLYTLNQEFKTPRLNAYMKKLGETYPNGYPEKEVASFRAKSLKLMPFLDCFTFNARSIVILVTLLTNIGWLYFAVEIVIFNLLLIYTISRHEKMCRELNQ